MLSRITSITSYFLFSGFILHHSKVFGIIRTVVAMHMVTRKIMSFYWIFMNLCNNSCILMAVSMGTNVFEVTVKNCNILT